MSFTVISVLIDSIIARSIARLTAYELNGLSIQCHVTLNHPIK